LLFIANRGGVLIAAGWQTATRGIRWTSANALKRRAASSLLEPFSSSSSSMVELFDPPIPPRPSSAIGGQRSPDSPSSPSTLSRSLTTFPRSPPDQHHNQHLPRSSTTAHRILRKQPIPSSSRKPVVSKINLLDLATEITAVIFRYAHKPKDFHFLLPSGAGPLIPRKYNLPLTVSREWYRRVRPIYYETLRLTWLRVPEFVEMIQREDVLGDYIQSIHVKIEGKQFYKVVRSQEARGDIKLSDAQLCLLIAQYIDAPLMTFALCLDSLVSIKDMTLRFSDCKGGEVSLQSIHLLISETDLAIASIVANLPPSVQNLYLDSATVAKQTPSNPYPIHLCPILRKHARNLKSLFLSHRFLVS